MTKEWQILAVKGTRFRYTVTNFSNNFIHNVKSNYKIPDSRRQFFSDIRKEEEDNESINSTQMANTFVSNDSDNQLQDAEIEENNRPDESDKVTIWSFVMPSLGIPFHVLDFLFDIILAMEYFSQNKILYFICTITFVVLPTIVNMSMGLRLSKWQKIHNQRTTAVAWKQKSWSIAVVHLLHLAPIFYNINVLRYAWKSRKCEKDRDKDGRRQYYKKMNDENEECALLKIFDAFLEAAPQQTLQMSIVIYNCHTNPSLRQVVSLITSFVSMGLTLMSYHRNIRLAEEDKPKISIRGSILQFLWHFFITVSRIASISVIASKWPILAVVCCFVHWLVMNLWLIVKPYGITSFCRDKVDNPVRPLSLTERTRSVLFAGVLGFVYIFTHLNPGKHRTYNRHLSYYSLCGIENIVAAAAIYWSIDSDESIRCNGWFTWLICLCIVPFFLGILFMIIYYKFSHPTLNSQESSSEQILPLFAGINDVLCCLSIFVCCHFT